MFGINVGGSNASNLTKARLDSLKLRTVPTKQAEESKKSGWNAYNLRTRMHSYLCAGIHKLSTCMILWSATGDQVQILEENFLA